MELGHREISLVGQHLHLVEGGSGFTHIPFLCRIWLSRSTGWTNRIAECAWTVNVMYTHKRIHCDSSWCFWTEQPSLFRSNQFSEMLKSSQSLCRSHQLYSSSDLYNLNAESWCNAYALRLQFTHVQILHKNVIQVKPDHPSARWRGWPARLQREMATESHKKTNTRAPLMPSKNPGC